MTAVQVRSQTRLSDASDTLQSPSRVVRPSASLAPLVESRARTGHAPTSFPAPFQSMASLLRQAGLTLRLLAQMFCFQAVMYELRFLAPPPAFLAVLLCPLLGSEIPQQVPQPFLAGVDSSPQKG